LPWQAVPWPLVLVASLSGLMESGVSSMLPSLSMRMGFSLEHAAWLGTVIGAGSALLQPPAGHLADRFGTRRIALSAWLVVMLANAVLLLAGERHSEVLWGVGFVLGGVGGAVYTLLIIELGHRLQGVVLVKAIAGLVVAYAGGTSLGPLVGGALFDVSGIQGLALAFVLLSGLGLMATAKGLIRVPGKARDAA
jgi:MFS family permease